MPEGAEVKRWSEGLNDVLTGKKLIGAQVIGGRYMRADPRALGLDRLSGATIQRVFCKGKLIVFHMAARGPDMVCADQGHFAVLSTLGMTGWWEPEYTLDATIDKYKRVEFLFDDNTRAVFFDPRNFGTIKVVSYDEMKRKLKELGPDIMSPTALDEAQNYPQFKERVKRFGKKLTLAEALLDQRIAAGCGNYIRADAMYLAKLSPHLSASELSDAQLRLIFDTMRLIAYTSYREADEYRNLVYGQTKDPKGHPVESYMDKNGRTVWWSPKGIV